MSEGVPHSQVNRRCFAYEAWEDHIPCKPGSVYRCSASLAMTLAACAFFCPCSEVQFRQVAGDFERFQGKWMLQEVPPLASEVGTCRGVLG